MRRVRWVGQVKQDGGNLKEALSRVAAADDGEDDDDDDSRETCD